LIASLNTAIYFSLLRNYIALITIYKRMSWTGACSTHGEMIKDAQNTLFEKSEGIKPVGRFLFTCIILKLILKKYGGWVRTECS
jgi:hypothetical protein